MKHIDDFNNPESVRQTRRLLSLSVETLVCVISQPAVQTYIHFICELRGFTHFVPLKVFSSPNELFLGVSAAPFSQDK